MARRLTAPAAPPRVGDLPVVERRLDNGLTALVLPRPGVPAVVCDLFYPVGSVDEPRGRTGLAHFVEHVLFKGTARYPKGLIDRLSFLAGGQANAETSEDCTHYWFALPAGRWELALELEADRMRGAAFDPAEVEAERRVIAEERARELDTPAGRLDQRHLTESYRRHPYRNPILGWPEDLERTEAADLRAFYDRHYRPDGAVLVVVGGVEADRVLDRVEARFGAIERGPARRPRNQPAEPRQRARRSFVLAESEGLARGLYGWHTVPIAHPDAPALAVLGDLLGCGRRGRLWDRLVERRRLATWVDAGQEGSRLAGQFLVQVEAAPGAATEAIEAAIRDELADLADRGPTADELARSRNRLEAGWRWEQEDLAGLAAGLGTVALWDDWRAWQAQHRAALTVEADDLRRVAAAYLDEPGLTVGWSIPRPSRSCRLRGPGDPTSPPTTAARPSPVRVATVDDWPAPAIVATGPGAGFRPKRSVLDNGLRLLTEQRPGTGVVALDLYVDAGLLREAKPGVAALTARLREEGTERFPEGAPSRLIEDVGGTLDVGSSGISVRVRSEDLGLAVELLADLSRAPALPADGLGWARRRTIAELRGDRDDPAFRADLAFRRLVYGEHPYARDPRGTATQVSGLGLDDLRAHHDRFDTPDNAFLVAVGDFEATRLRALVRRHLGGWRPSGRPKARLPRRPIAAPPRVRRVDHPGEQVHVFLGHLGIERRHPDFDALAVLDQILGSGPGFTDRLGAVLRDELGLAYAVGGGFTDSADLAPGMFRVYVGTGPDEAARAVAVARELILAVRDGQFTDAEVEAARAYLAGSWVFDYQAVAQRADRLVELESWGLPLDEPSRRADRLAALTPAAVRRAARRHIDPAALVRVELGPRPRRSSRRGGGP